MAEEDRDSERSRRREQAERRSREREEREARKRKPGADRRGISRARNRKQPGSPRRQEQLRRAITALKEGGSETRKQLRGRPGEAGKRAGTAAARSRTILGGLFAGLVTLVGALVAFSRGPLLSGLKRLRRALAAVAGVITPARGLAIAAIGCALLLGLSQFVDYRGVSVGGAQFTGNLGTVAPPPTVDVREAGDPHSYAFVPVAVISIALLALAFARRRWQLTRVVALAGVAAVVVSIFIDRPQGLDEGVTSQAYAGVEAQLLGGFWAQLFAGVGLAGTSLLLGQELRRLARSPESEGARPSSRSRAAGSSGGRRLSLPKRKSGGAEEKTAGTKLGRPGREPASAEETTADPRKPRRPLAGGGKT